MRLFRVLLARRDLQSDFTSFMQEKPSFILIPDVCLCVCVRVCACLCVHACIFVLLACMCVFTSVLLVHVCICVFHVCFMTHVSHQRFTRAWACQMSVCVCVRALSSACMCIVF